MSMEDNNNKIVIDKNKLLPLKNKIKEQFNQNINTDCETLKNVFFNVINKLPKYKFKSNEDNVVKSDSFNLNIINNLYLFQHFCDFDIAPIEKDLSNALGVETCFSLESKSGFIFEDKYNLKIHISNIKI